MHRVSALACEARVILGQWETPSKTNELTAIRRLLDSIPLRGALVSIDAMGCQTNLATRITNRDADHLLAVRDNQPTLRAQIEAAFQLAGPGTTRNVDLPEPPATPSHCASDAGHGRIETRTTTVMHDFGEHLDVVDKWAGLTTLIRVDRVREHEGSDLVENAVRYYISSRQLSAEAAGKHVRRHGEVENKLHYVLDVSFGEDGYTARKQNAAANFIVIPHFAVNLIRALSRDKLSFPRRRRRCDDKLEHREQLLTDVAM